MPISANAASATSGWRNSNGNNRPSSHSPVANISGRATRKISPFWARPSHRWPAPGTAHAAAQIKYGFVVDRAIGPYYRYDDRCVEVGHLDLQGFDRSREQRI